MALVTLAAAAACCAVPAIVHAAPPRYVKVFLALRHERGLGRFVRHVSDPSSTHYRDYASVRRLKRRFGASRRTRRAVRAWLAAHGLRGRPGPTGTYVLARAPAGKAERLLAAGSAAGTDRLDRGKRAAPAPVPRALRDYVSAVSLLSPRPGAIRTGARSASSGSAAIPPLPPKHGSWRDRTGTPSGCAAGREAGYAPPDSGFTPNQYLTAYGHAALHSAGLRGRGQRVALVEIDGFDPNDIRTFAGCFGISPPPIHLHTVASPVLEPGPETTLDLEVLSAAAPDLRRIDVYEGSSQLSGILATTARALGTRGNRPDVISISLESCEPEWQGARSLWRGLRNVFAVAAGAGISVLVAAGDDGSSMCTNASGVPLGLVTASVPADQPYVTAVGGTNLVLDGANRIVNQVVWNDSPADFGAGGGAYSVMAPRPWWQRHTRGVDDRARSVPDLAALADTIPGYAIYCTAASCNGYPQQSPGWVAIGGTSAATPLLAGATALLDQAAHRHGQAPLGFLDPLLYRLGRRSKGRRIFWDVRHGNNDLGRMIPKAAGGGAPLGCCSARRGYDRANGLGSPRLQALRRAAIRAGAGHRRAGR